VTSKCDPNLNFVPVFSGSTVELALAYWYTTPEVVGSIPTQALEFAGGAWFIPRTESVN
jgi:hypothetical protein